MKKQLFKKFSWNPVDDTYSLDQSDSYSSTFKERIHDAIDNGYGDDDEERYKESKESYRDTIQIHYLSLQQIGRWVLKASKGEAQIFIIKH